MPRPPEAPSVERVLLLDPRDDLAVALADLPAGYSPEVGEAPYALPAAVPAKQKFTLRNVPRGHTVRMYGVTVGRATESLPAGTLVTTDNLAHAVDALAPGAVADRRERPAWAPPVLPKGLPKSFEGYARADGSVGVANYWLVVPLVFCENRNVEVLRESLETQLGFRQNQSPRFDLGHLLAARREGRDLRAAPVLDRERGVESEAGHAPPRSPHFPHVDGLRFLTHEGGCGGTRGDARLLIRLLAGYLAHPNVAGATVLSLGCQNAQVSLLLGELEERSAGPQLRRTAPGVRAGSYGGRRLVVAEQQGATAGESAFLAETLRQTVIGLAHADEARRATAPAAKLCLGLECGGSDGFSGVTANPLLGRVSDYLVGLGGRSLLAEFPELNGVEAELMRRCERAEEAARFGALMRAYGAAAAAAGSGFSYNPSPGNIREGLVTDAMKSAGAARKGGAAPVTRVLDYGEPARRPGLHLLCTPGNDVESTTALAGSGAQLIAFTTGLGTPTGNPVAPTLKLSSNTALARAQPDLIDFDAGQIVSAGAEPGALAQQFWRKLIDTASGRYVPKAVRLGQHDFIPWRRDLSL